MRAASLDLGTTIRSDNIGIKEHYFTYPMSEDCGSPDCTVLSREREHLTSKPIEFTCHVLGLLLSRLRLIEYDGAVRVGGPVHAAIDSMLRSLFEVKEHPTPSNAERCRASKPFK